MELVPFRYPTFIIIAALLALLGDLLALAHLPIAYAFLPAGGLLLMMFLVRLLNTFVQRRANDIKNEPARVSSLINHGWHSSVGVSVGAALCVVPVAFHIYAAHKCQTIDALSKYSGRAVVVQGILTAAEKRDEQSAAVDLEARRLLFPVRQDCTCEMHLICFAPRHSGETAAGSVPLERLPELKIGSQISAEIVVPSNRKSSANASRCLTALCHHIWCDDQVPGVGQNLIQCRLSVTRVADGERARLVRMHQNCIGAELGDLLSSMVLGDKAVRLDPDTVKVFRDVGLSHVLAASGFNLTVVIAMTYFIGRLVLRSELLVHALCVLTMFCFVCLAGTSASVMRAAIMCCVMLLVRTFALRAHLLAVIAIALLITLTQDPQAATDVGLQLSYAATVGIVLVSKSLVLLMCVSAKGFKRWLCETLAVVLASQSAVLPIQLAYFWQIGLMFVPANLVIAPMLGPVTILGFSSSTLWMICPSVSGIESVVFVLCRVIDWFGVVPLRLMLNVVRFLASFEGAKLHVGSPSSGAIVCYVAAWLLLVCSLRIKRYRAGASIVYACALALLFWRPSLMYTTITCNPTTIVVTGRDRACTVVCLRACWRNGDQTAGRAGSTCAPGSQFARDAQHSAAPVCMRTLSFDLQKTCACNGWHVENIVSQTANKPVICDTEDATIIIVGSDTAINTMPNSSRPNRRSALAPGNVESPRPTVLVYPTACSGRALDLGRLSRFVDACRADFVTIVGPESAVADLSGKFCEKLDRDETRSCAPMKEPAVPSLRIVAQTVQAATIPTYIKRRTD